MVWQRIDDQFGVSQKVIRIPRKRRQQCVGLWLLATNYSVRALTDGVLEAHELEELDARPTDIAELVRVGMWHGPQHSCGRCPRPPKGGVVIHDFLIYNKSRSQVEAEREKERVRKNAYRASTRSPDGTPDGTPDGREAESEHPVPSRPVPSRPLLTDITPDPLSSPVGDGPGSGLDAGEVVQQKAKRAGIKSLAKVRAQLADVVGDITPSGAVELVDAITKKAKGEIKSVDAYVATVCRNSPQEVLWDYEHLDIGAVA